jgi:carboxyl-terminal processing protease
MGKLYRLNGETTQWNGVIPDVELPDEYEGLDYHEKFLPNALPPDTARKNSYYKPLDALPLQSLSIASKKRIAESPVFQNINSIITRTRSERTGLVIPLQPAAFEKWVSDRDLKDVSSNIVFSSTNKEIEKDIYIQESFLIMTDLINLSKK